MSGRQLAVITGAGGGIGREIALHLAQAGFDIAVSDLELGEEAENLIAAAEATGARAWTQACDVGIKAEVDSFYDALRGYFNRNADVLINNAGVQTWSSLLDLQEADWDRVIRTNLKGCFLNTQAVARRLVEDGRPGSIVNIGSGCNKTAFPKLIDYTASKGGVEQFTKAAAVDLGPYDIRVNCVAPGAIVTDRTLAETPDYDAVWGAITPLGRGGRPKDVAQAVLFFATEASDFVTGQTLWVDGGIFTRPNWPY